MADDTRLDHDPALPGPASLSCLTLEDVGDFLECEHGRTVLANAAIKLLMRQDSATIEPVVAAFGLSPEERRFLLGAQKGEGLFFARGSHVALTVEASPLEHRLATTAPRELAERPPDHQPASPSANGVVPSGPPRRLHRPAGSGGDR